MSIALNSWVFNLSDENYSQYSELNLSNALSNDIETFFHSSTGNFLPDIHLRLLFTLFHDCIRLMAHSNPVSKKLQLAASSSCIFK